MRNLLPLLFVLAACSAPQPLTEQEKAELFQRIRARIARMPDELKLTQEQYRVTRPIVKEMQEGVFQAVIDYRKSDRSLSSARRFQKEIRKVRMDTEAKLEPILDERQLAAVRQCFDDIRTIVKNIRAK